MINSLARRRAGLPASGDLTLDQIKTLRLMLLTEACAAAITGGFISAALGMPHTYPSKATDQTNLSGSVLKSMMAGSMAGWITGFACADEMGVWADRDHTATQIQQVGLDLFAWVEACRAKLKTLATALAAAGTVAEAEAVVW